MNQQDSSTQETGIFRENVTLKYRQPKYLSTRSKQLKYDGFLLTRKLEFSEKI
jgi:hypothetical protein